MPLVQALKFDVQAHPGHESGSKERCIRNFAAADTLVVVTATVSGYKGDGQLLNMHVRSPEPLVIANAVTSLTSNTVRSKTPWATTTADHGM